MTNLNFAELHVNLAAPHPNLDMSHTLRLCNVSAHFYASSQDYYTSTQLSCDPGYVAPQPELNYANSNFWPVFRLRTCQSEIRIRFKILLSTSKTSKKNLDSYCTVTSL
jgi:hypothetical protein